MFMTDNAWKIAKRGREAYLPMLAEVIKNPDEIWTWLEWHRNQQQAFVSRAYIGRWNIEGKDYTALVVLERSGNTWRGITAHASNSANDMNAKIERNRRGIRLFKRTE